MDWICRLRGHKYDATYLVPEILGDMSFHIMCKRCFNYPIAVNLVNHINTTARADIWINPMLVKTDG